MSKEEQLIENLALRTGIEEIIKDLNGRFEWTKADVLCMLEKALKAGAPPPPFGFCPYCRKKHALVPVLLLVDHQDKGQRCEGADQVPGEDEESSELGRMVEPEDSLGKTIVAVTRKPDETTRNSKHPEEVVTFHFSDGTTCGIFTEMEEE